MKSPLRLLIPATLLIIGATVFAIRMTSEPAADPAYYVGQESCMSSGCHADAYGEHSDYKGAAMFRETMHQNIHLRPTPQTVIIDNYFAGDSVLKFYEGGVNIPGKDTFLVYLSKGKASLGEKAADYYIQLKFSEGGDTTPRMKVAYTYGGNGWIQRFLVQVGTGLYVTPFQYVLPAYRNRSPVGGAFYYLDRDKWFKVDSSTNGEGEFFKFNTPTFRSKSWQQNCAFCHVNGFDLVKIPNGGTDTTIQAFWPGVAERDSALTDQNIKIGCESCHGPGSDHVASPTKEGSILNPKKWPMTFDQTDLKLDLCGQCHTRIKSTTGKFNYPFDDAQWLPYRPGQSMKNFSRNWPYNGMNLWPDGRTSYAHHQTNQDYMRSVEYDKHLFKNGCWDCHTVHYDKDDLPFQLNQDWYTLESGEGCITCHEDMIATSLRGDRLVNTHTQHSPEISQCVNCHFTKTASIAFVDLPGKPLYEFTDHGFTVLSPKLTLDYQNAGFIGMINTCAEACHRNGRGSRNFADSLPVAPYFGIRTDRRIGTWNEGTDLELADSLWYHYKQMYAGIIGATHESSVTTGGTAISSIAPNPLSGTTTIRFTLAARTDILLDIFDMNGKHVRTLAAGTHAPGAYSQIWEGDDQARNRVANGAYMVKLTAGKTTVTSKIVVAR